MRRAITKLVSKEKLLIVIKAKRRMNSLGPYHRSHLFS